MMLWFIFAALSLAVLGLLLPPLLRLHGGSARRVDYDIVVYRDQLAEVGRDLERGLLDDAQAAAARTEIHRRMLAAEDAELAMPRAGAPVGGRRRRLAAAIAIGMALPAGASALYLMLGSPGLADQPFAARQADPAYKMASMAERLAAALASKPDADGYATLASTLSALHRYPEAADAYRKAIAMGSVDAELMASLGESIALANDGDVVPDARQAFQQALSLDKTDARSRFYLGLAEAQTGQYAAAVSIWRDLEQSSPADAPWLGMLKEHIAQYAKLGGFDPATIKPVPPAPASIAKATSLPP